ncbi:zinc ribbon domain-containing protein [Bacillus sp. CMF21]|uniref:FxLYD domain-containing protein n=1 Tax=Metabacillus dongyingensis TaxID=2874282 RepID=UPI001CBBC9BB|nr:FxLYD domain-containing protein [Metabacillus dongyingensis]UAL50690.1 zinc ribbon domain-containing protein [Metabacillus dongyingensis]USK26959.1 zinc ribbon domain-containing protein [Bacillus sp. CMF21]
MQCHYCGEREIEKFSNYCPHCGNKLFLNDRDRKLYRLSKRSLYILPAASFVLVSSLLFAVYEHEAAKNEEVVKLQKKAEQSALAGEYNKALQYAEKGIHLRSGYDVLKQEKELIMLIQEYNQDLEQIKEHIQKSNYNQASTEIDLLTRIISGHTSPLYSRLQSELSKADMNVTVGEIKEQINELNSIDQLAEKLKEVTVLDAAEADIVKEQIKSKMVMIGSLNAEEDLTQKQFNSAILIVDKALQYDGDNEKLLSLKDKILSEKTAFEQAEQKRIERAVTAAKEEKRLKDEAVKVLETKVTVDEFGDAKTSGKIKNTSKSAIHSITVQFTVSDKDGKEIERGKTNVYPNELKPGKEAAFEHITYGVNDEVVFTIENIIWYQD